MPLSSEVPHRRRFNALKHGLRSGSVLLPGDNVAAFRKLRERLFHLHKPRTIEEALCVETIAAGHWRMARCRMELSGFKAHLGAVMDGDADATASLWDPDPHTLHHRAADCSQEEQRLDRQLTKTHLRLRDLQKQRTQHLSAADVLEDYTVFLAEGEPVIEEPPAARAEAEAVTLPREPVRATSKEDGRIGEIRKRDAAAPRSPQHWSRRQKEAAARRDAAGTGSPTPAPG